MNTAGKRRIVVSPCRDSGSETLVSRKFHKLHIRAVFEKIRNDSFIFLRGKGTGGIKKLSAGTQHIRSLQDQFFLQNRKLVGFFRCPVSGKCIFFTEHTFTGAGGIQQDFVKKFRKTIFQMSRCLIGHKCIGDAKKFYISKQRASSGRTDIVSDKKSTAV